MAYKTVESIVKTTENILFSGQYQVDEFLGEPYRRLVVKHFKVIYRIKKDSIFIFRVFDTRQNPSKLK